MELIAEKREIFGKKTKHLRDDRKLPAVIFGKGLESISVSVDFNNYVKVFNEAGETSVIDLMVGGKKHPVLVKDVQYHHINNHPVHVGFYEVDLKQKITAQVPVEVINEEQNELIKGGEFLILTLLDEIEVECLPTDIPHEFIVDATKLVSEDSVITIGDLAYDKSKVEIVGLESDELVAKLDYAVMAEEVEEEKTEAELMEGVEAIEEKDVEEGEGTESGEKETGSKETEEKAQE